MELLEREAILDELRRALREAAAGRGSLALLAGEAVAGKTVLLRRFMAEVGGEAVALLGQYDARSTPRPLGPVFDFAEAEPALRRLLAGNAPREQLFRAEPARLGSGGRPVLLAIEDAHWADEATLDLVRYLGRRLEGTRAVILVTHRDDEVGPRHPFRRALGDLAAVAAVRRLSLPPSRWTASPRSRPGPASASVISVSPGRRTPRPIHAVTRACAGAGSRRRGGGR